MTNHLFLDAYMDIIVKVNYDGTNRKTVKKGRLVCSTFT